MPGWGNLQSAQTRATASPRAEQQWLQLHTASKLAGYTKTRREGQAPSRVLSQCVPAFVIPNCNVVPESIASLPPEANTV